MTAEEIWALSSSHPGWESGKKWTNTALMRLIVAILCNQECSKVSGIPDVQQLWRKGVPRMCLVVSGPQKKPWGGSLTSLHLLEMPGGDFVSTGI